MSDPATTSTDMLTPTEQSDLRLLAGIMIPADQHLGAPGADDPMIMADMIGAVGRDFAAVKRMLSVFRREVDASGAPAAGTDDVATLKQRLREHDAGELSSLEAVILRAYYRDDRVLRSIGMEPRPPFPKGYAVDEGDWTLLEPVTARGRIWRDVTFKDG